MAEPVRDLESELEPRPITKVTKKISKLSVSSSSKKGKFIMAEPVRDPESEPEPRPVTKVTKKISKLSVSSSSKKGKVQGSREKQTTGRVIDTDIFKYRGCSWPNVVGLKADEAKRIIEKGKPDLSCIVVPETQLQTMSYSTRRVRLIVDKYNKVVRIPRVG